MNSGLPRNYDAWRTMSEDDYYDTEETPDEDEPIKEEE